VGLTALDAGPLVAFLDASDPRHAAARRQLAAARDRGDPLIIPASSLAEVLVEPARKGADAVAEVRRFVERLPIEVVPLDEAIAVAAAQLRARHGTRLRLPDAIVVATAHVLDADVLVTTERTWPPRSRLGLRARLVKL
jgi:predicted nucleic acid-binding protein